MRRQLSFNGFTKISDVFGGSLLKSNPKSKRPVHSKFPIHLTLKANKSQMRLFKTKSAVDEIVATICKKYGVRIYDYANVGNHLHFNIKLRSVLDWSAFIRELTGRIAQITQQILGPREGKFWKCRPFTRIVRSWRKGFKILRDYIELNQLEAEGLINRKEIKTLKDLRAIWAGD